MNSITYVENTLPEQESFFQLLLTTGWNDEYHFTSSDTQAALAASWYRVSAYDGDKLVGFGRVVSDGKWHALITEMIVLPEYQGQGIGKQVLQLLTKTCEKHEIRDIQLFAAKGKVPFYEKNGFQRRPEEGPGMEKRRK